MKKNNEDCYHVFYPITSWEMTYMVQDCRKNNSDGKLTVSCSVIEVVNPYEPYEEKIIGIGDFIYDASSKLKFEKFEFKASQTSDNNE